MVCEVSHSELWRQLDAFRQIDNEGTPNSEICVQCGTQPANSYVKEGYSTCGECGTVQNVVIESCPEWRTFYDQAGGAGKGTSPVRCSTTPALLVSRHTTTKGAVNTLTKNRSRMGRWYSHSAQERVVMDIQREFETIGRIGDLPTNIVSAATQLYIDLNAKMQKTNCGVKRCNVRLGLQAACVFFACKELKMPRENKEVAEIVNTTTSVVIEGRNDFMNIMGEQYIKMEPFQPADFIQRFCQLLDVPYRAQCHLQLLVAHVTGYGALAECNPSSVTAACILLLARCYGLDISLAQIHKKCRTSPSVVSKTLNLMRPLTDDLMKLLRDLS